MALMEDTHMNIVKDAMNVVCKEDEEVGKALEAEFTRQQNTIELIASENIVSPAVMMAMAPIPTSSLSK